MSRPCASRCAVRRRRAEAKVTGIGRLLTTGSGGVVDPERREVERDRRVRRRGGRGQAGGLGACGGKWQERARVGSPGKREAAGAAQAGAERGAAMEGAAGDQAFGANGRWLRHGHRLDARSGLVLAAGDLGVGPSSSCNLCGREGGGMRAEGSRAIKLFDVAGPRSVPRLSVRNPPCCGC